MIWSVCPNFSQIPHREAVVTTPNRPKSSTFSVRLRIARELASQCPHSPTWKIADCRSEPRFRPLCIHSQAPLRALTPGTVGALLKVGRFPAFDGHSGSEESTCMSLFRCLMNGCAGFVNALIAEMNVSKLANPHCSIFFLCKQLSRDRTFRIPCRNQHMSLVEFVTSARPSAIGIFLANIILDQVHFLELQRLSFSSSCRIITPATPLWLLFAKQRHATLSLILISSMLMQISCIHADRSHHSFSRHIQITGSKAAKARSRAIISPLSFASFCRQIESLVRVISSLLF
jgi:hypothetical protein